MRLAKKVCLITGTLLLLFVAAGMAGKIWWDAHFFDGYDSQLPLNAVVRGETPEPNYRLVDFTYDGLPGMPVPTLMALPDDTGASPYPCIIFLHGIGQDKEFLKDIAAPFVDAGFAFVSFDQYTRGERKLVNPGWLEQALAFRRRSALNVIETRRLVDYLLTRPDIAADRIYLIGASFGAITGSTAVAFEPRIAAAVMTYGGGDLDKLLSSDAAKAEMGPYYWPVKKFVAFLTAPSDPVKYVAGIAPRPLLFQNGTHDRLIPVAAADALYEAARDPKERTLYDSDHVGLDADQTRQVLDDSIAWLEKIDAARVARAPTQ